jgi:hypothetical protein
MLKPISASLRSATEIRQVPLTRRIFSEANRNTFSDKPENLVQQPSCGSADFLARHSFSRRTLERAIQHSRLNGTTAATELLAHGAITEEM